MNPCPIPVICDRCRAEGVAGDDPFAAFGTLLDFEPVPRRKRRADGWTPEVQRAFVAALSLTGSDRAATRAVGKAQFGVDQLRRAEGNESFLAACDEAMAMAADERSRRLAEGLRAIAAEQSGWRPPAPPWARGAGRRFGPPLPVAEQRSASELTEREERDKLEALERVFAYYLQRLTMERRARLTGKVAEADFYVRQITVFEICVDLLGRGEGKESVATLIRDLSVDGHHLSHVAETTMSRLLDEARRDKWAELGEPARPGLPRPDQLVVGGRDYQLIKQEVFRGGPDREEQERAQKAEYAAAARAQVEWEARAIAEAAAWRARLEAEAEAAAEAPLLPRGEGSGVGGGEAASTAAPPPDAPPAQGDAPLALPRRRQREAAHDRPRRPRR